MRHQIGSMLRKLSLAVAAFSVAAAFAMQTAQAQEQPPAAPVPEVPASAQLAPAQVFQDATPSTPAPTSEATPAAPAVPTQPSDTAVGSQQNAEHQPAAPDAAADHQPLPAASAVGKLPHDLSPWSMFLAADIVVKAVMIGLIFASVVTWTVWLAKSLELAWAKKKLAGASRKIAGAVSLDDARRAVQDKRGPVAALLDLASTELRLSAGINDKAGVKERVSSRLDGLTSAAGRDMNRGTGVLATIGSTAPFVGLFGTVWGIMNSFIGISESQTTNLAVVAPGIAEALLATAIGLVAAIPAVIIYNQFARSISAYKAAVAEASAEVLRLVSRDLDRGTKTALSQAAE